MGLFDCLGKVKKNRQTMKYAKMLNGYTPVFSSFGDNIYASDIVQAAIRCIANEMSKLNPQHIRTDPQGMRCVVNGAINKLLKFGPNELMTTSDFIEKIVYLRETTKNAFIYPTYKEITISNEMVKREYTGFYPLNPIQVDFLEDITGKLYIKMYFKNSQQYTMPYNDIIHWRKDYGANEFLGGDENGNANNTALLKLLKTDDVTVQGIDKGVKAGLSVRGIIKVNTMLEDEKQEEERAKFEKKLNNSESGILAIDLKNDFVPININPTSIDSSTLNFIQQRILNNYGISLPIFNGDFTEEQYQAFYEKTLEPMVISLGRVFSKSLFTTRELEVGNEVIFYSQGLTFTNMQNKIAAVDVLSSRGVLTDNQILDIFGYPPFEGGDVRHMSLNYINRDIADQYQLNNIKLKGKEGQ